MVGVQTSVSVGLMSSEGFTGANVPLPRKLIHVADGLAIWWEIRVSIRIPSQGSQWSSRHGDWLVFQLSNLKS